VNPETRVGILVAVGLAAVMAMILLIGQFAWFEKSYTIYADFTNIEMLDVDFPVRLAGVKVGRVSDIRFVDDKVRVAMSIKHEVGIRADALVTITTGIILGETYVDISIGSLTLPYVVDGAVVRGVDPISTGRLVATVQSVAERMDTLAGSLGEVLGEKEKADLREIIATTRKMTDNIEKITSENAEDVHETILAYKQAASDLSGNLKTLSTNINNLVAKLSDVVDENRAHLKDTTETLGRIGPQLEETIEALRMISEKVEAGEGTIGKLVTEETIYDDARLALGDARDAFTSVEEAAEGAREFLAPATGMARKAEELRLLWLVSLDRDVSRSFGRADAGIKIQTSPQKYYVLEANHLNADDDDDEDDDDERDKIRYSGYMGYSFGLPNTYFRFGMMESGGGVGVEHYMLSDKLRLTLDGFANDGGTQGRMGAEYWFNDNLALRIGLHRWPDKPAARLGLRVEFQDDDLKTLLSTFR
jgi:phospholipid/cholesterol/gamma-HCH transport system substrate-binding protein